MSSGATEYQFLSSLLTRPDPRTERARVTAVLFGDFDSRDYAQREKDAEPKHWFGDKGKGLGRLESRYR